MRRNIRDIQQFKRDGQRIAMLTAYDAMSALAAEDAGAENPARRRFARHGHTRTR